MPSLQLTPTTCAYAIRRALGSVPMTSTQGEPYAFVAGDTRGWFGVDKHRSPGDEFYYGMVVLLEFDGSALPPGAVVTGASLSISIQNNPSADPNGMVVWTWASTPPADEGDYTLEASGPVTAIPAGVTGQRVLQVSAGAVSAGSFGIGIAGVGASNQGSYDWLELSASNHCYLRIGFPPVLTVLYEVPPPQGAGFLHGVLELSTSGGGGNVQAQARGYLRGVLELTTASLTRGIGLGALRGVLELTTSSGAIARAPAELHGVLQLGELTTPRAQGTLRGVLELSTEVGQGGQARALGVLHGVLMLEPAPPPGSGDVPLSELLPFSMSAVATVQVERNALVLGSSSISASSSFTIQALDAGLLLPRSAIGATGELSCGVELRGTVELESSFIVSCNVELTHRLVPYRKKEELPTLRGRLTDEFEHALWKALLHGDADELTSFLPMRLVLATDVSYDEHRVLTWNPVAEVYTEMELVEPRLLVGQVLLEEPPTMTPSGFVLTGGTLRRPVAYGLADSPLVAQLLRRGSLWVAMRLLGDAITDQGAELVLSALSSGVLRDVGWQRYVRFYAGETAVGDPALVIVQELPQSPTMVVNIGDIRLWSVPGMVVLTHVGIESGNGTVLLKAPLKEPVVVYPGTECVIRMGKLVVVFA